MGRSLAVTTALSADDLRKLARREGDGRVSLRLISVAAVLEGAKRHVAARQGGMDRQTLCDWAHRFNTDGVEGLHASPPDRGSAPPARLGRHGARFRPDGRHRLGVALRHDEACRHAPRRADRTKDMGRDGSQVLWRRGPCAAPRRASCYPGLLPDTRFVLPPPLYGCSCARTRPDLLQLGGEVFFRIRNRARVLRLMPGHVPLRAVSFL